MYEEIPPSCRIPFLSGLLFRSSRDLTVWSSTVARITMMIKRMSVLPCGTEGLNMWY